MVGWLVPSVCSPITGTDPAQFALQQKLRCPRISFVLSVSVTVEVVRGVFVHRQKGSFLLFLFGPACSLASNLIPPCAPEWTMRAHYTGVCVSLRNVAMHRIGNYCCVVTVVRLLVVCFLRGFKCSSVLCCAAPCQTQHCFVALCGLYYCFLCDEFPSRAAPSCFFFSIDIACRLPLGRDSKINFTRSTNVVPPCPLLLTPQIPRPFVGGEPVTYRTCTPPSVAMPPFPTSNYVALDEVHIIMCFVSTPSMFLECAGVVRDGAAVAVRVLLLYDSCYIRWRKVLIVFGGPVVFFFVLPSE